MKDSIESARFEVSQRVRNHTQIELAVIRARVNDRALAIALRNFDAAVMRGELPSPRRISDEAFMEVESDMNELLGSGE